MKRWTKRFNITIMTLMIFASQATVALARAGGGKGGSLGGSLGGSAGRSFSSGSFSGGIPSSGLGGFSFFPFFWGPSFFGLGGGGSLFGGFFSLIFMLIIAFLIIKALRSSIRPWGKRKGRGKGFGDPYSPQSPQEWESNPSPLTPVDVTGRPITNENNLQRFGKAIQFTRENMRYYSETFPRWDRDFLVGRVRQVYFWLQDAWTRQDLSGGEVYLSSTILQKYQTDLANMRNRGERNVIKEPVLNAGDIEFIHSHLDDTAQHFVTMISASLFDYTVDTSGKIIAGEDDNRLYFTEFWEFSWEHDQWVLSNIYQEDALEITKIARGDEH
ncbi:TIM44-like domain-containing protein [Desulfitobacterium metallireducens]|uniref:Import inner membrane translocase subunit Tim44 n=1 Tax=Desulfitobacterium metallireducens DSM 15288 TaxID=871968 RepID=W0E8T0_9FIRM|nr:TIM44-like domain-containing protein [Desulfitobacterium metallireducens]AHF07152.1 import inner membrane translocase subunit Tim44 [Desulfitobacterium metallireducens DSM 15288]